MAPEILDGKPYGKEVDIWSFGCLVLEMINGSPPYYNHNPEKVNLLRSFLTHKAIQMIIENGVSLGKTAEKMSVELRGFLTRCLTYDPKSRPAVEDLMMDTFIMKYRDLCNPFLS